MNSVKVVLTNGNSQTFTTSGTLAVEMQQFWLIIHDQDGRTLGAVPREQVNYFTTSLNA